MTSSVSVIMPVFNGKGFLSRAVDSVLAQTQLPRELVIVDDGSTDAGIDALGRLQDRAALPVRLVRQENAGQSAARNHGIEVADGDLLAFLDQDDVWHPQFLATMVAQLEQDSTVGWAYCDFDEIDVDGRIITRGFLERLGAEHPKLALTDCLVADIMAVPSASVMRRAALGAVGGFDETLRGYEDDDLYIRMFRSGWMHVFVPRSLSQFRVHSGSSSDGHRFLESRGRFADKLRAAVEDDRRRNRFYYIDLVAPRFFQTSLDDYVRAICIGDWDNAIAAEASLRRFGRERRARVARWRFAVMRRPRLFRRLLRLHQALPRRLQLSQNPSLQPR